MSGVIRFKDVDNGPDKRVSTDDPLPTTSTGPAGAALATEETLGNVETALTTPATSIPHFGLDATLDYTPGNVSRSGAGETTMVSATASQTTRLYQYAVTVPAAGTVEIRDGASGTVKRKHIFAAAGGIVRDDRAGRPWAVTTANTALVFYYSGTGEANIDFDYVKGV